MRFQQVGFLVASDRGIRFSEHEVLLGKVSAGIVGQNSQLGDDFSDKGVPSSSVKLAGVNILHKSEFVLPQRCSQFQRHVPEDRQKRK
jgi:hypothetical protein